MVDVKGRDECWPWRGKLYGTGQYGMFARKVDEKWQTVSAHRLSFELTKGPIPKGLQICHSCDFGPCCNPQHLFVGTQTDNIIDMFDKERGNAKLTKQAVSEIRQSHRSLPSTDTVRRLARKHLVHPRTIRNVINVQTWAHLP
jgi:hypothetical protein